MYPATTARIHAIPCPLLQPGRGISVQSTRPAGALAIFGRHPSAALRPSAAAAFRPFSSFLYRRLPSSRTGDEPLSSSIGRRRAAAFFFCSAAKASSPEEAFVKTTVSAHDIVIFSKTYCPYCSTAKAVFKKLDKVPYVVELDQREDGQDIQYALEDIIGRRTVPQVFIKGEHLGGSDDTVEAYENGRLVKLLGIGSK